MFAGKGIAMVTDISLSPSSKLITSALIQKFVKKKYIYSLSANGMLSLTKSVKSF